MPYCKNCGKKLSEGASFCASCGQPVDSAPKRDPRKRETVFDGQIHKCPSCGTVLDSFVMKCPACGYELRDTAAPDSLQEFYRELNRASTPEKQMDFIRNFPIPNTKEDILEFMILAVSNIRASGEGRGKGTLCEAWIAKFEQCYEKAVLLFRTDPDFARIQQLYEEEKDNIDAIEKRRKIRGILFLILRNIVVCAGLAVVIIGLSVYRKGGNASFLELAGTITLIASAAALRRRGATVTDFGIAAVSGLALIGISFLFSNGFLLQLGGGIILIITAVNFIHAKKG